MRRQTKKEAEAGLHGGELGADAAHKVAEEPRVEERHLLLDEGALVRHHPPQRARRQPPRLLLDMPPVRRAR